VNVLVAAWDLALNRTSEGICSAKFVATTAGAGHHVRCLTLGDVGEAEKFVTCPWLRTASVRRITTERPRGIGATVAVATTAIGRSGAAGRSLERKVNWASAFTTGYSVDSWRLVALWAAALRRAVAEQRPDVIVTRGAGFNFEGHIAMLRNRLDVPWIAHYHDPYPLSLYPVPYRRRVRFMSALQERTHREILARADGLSFTNERLLSWVLQGDLARHAHKSRVIGHVVMGLVPDPAESAAPRSFTLVHTGTMLGARDPNGLLMAFRKFVDGKRPGQARLVFAGRIDARHRALPAWRSLETEGWLINTDERMTYTQALELARNATAAVIIEADTSPSPFYPGKLADYLWLRRPILALSPRASATADILGVDDPLRVDPGDSDAIGAAIERLWGAWAANDLSGLLPATRIVQSLSEGSIATHIDELLQMANATATRSRAAA
jgi:hypothetical protein